VDWDKVPAFGSIPFFEWIGTALGTAKKGEDFREATSATFLVAGSASLLLAAFSFTLPHTPPKPAVDASEKLAWLEAMRLLRIPFVLVLFIVTFFDAAVHQCYFFWTERYLTGGVEIASNWVTPIMSIGQVAEIGTLAFLGYVLKHLGWRYTMAIGVFGHAVRFFVFAYFPIASVAIIINLLHGICYAFFFATVYIFVDEFFPKNARSSAQGLFNFLILGLGPFLGNFLWAYLGEAFATEGRIDFQDLFLVPAAIALGAALFLFVFFRPPAKAETGRLPTEVEEALARDSAWSGQGASEGIKDPTANP
jgi:predicted MFS family arabinose efflux permease